MSKNEDKITITEREAISKVLEYKKIAETNIVSILWKNPDLFHMYDSLTVKSFSDNRCKVYFAIGYDIIKKENKTLDEITIDMYLEKHEKLKDKYISMGGYDIVDTAKYVNEQNIEGYVDELGKWNAVIELYKKKFPIAEKLTDFVDCSSEDIYDYYEVMVNNIFLNVSGKDVVHKLGDDIESIIDRLDEGESLGMPINGMPLLDAEIGGWHSGLTLIGGTSGSGKSTYTRSVFMKSVLENDEKLLIIANEEGHVKFTSELLILVSNVIYGKSIQKHILRNGGLDTKMKEWLKKVPAKWIKEHSDQIIMVSMDSFSVDKSIKLIRKYNSLYGIDNVIIDTFKSDYNDSSDQTWKTMSTGMRKLFDVAKEEGGLNIRLLCTFQLNKSSTKQRCYTMDNVGESKSIVDCAGLCMMLRHVLPDEMPGGKNEIKCWMPSGKSGLTKTPVELDSNKRYQLIFLIKNRYGTANQHCIVMEVDMSRNIYKEVGLCIINPDW